LFAVFDYCRLYTGIFDIIVEWKSLKKDPTYAVTVIFIEMKMKVVISETGFFSFTTYIFCSWWLYGLSHGSVAACLLGLQV